jgi:small subunit ribosomal protein S20
VLSADCDGILFLCDERLGAAKGGELQLPNIKSSIKDVKSTIIRTNRNAMAKSLLRTSIRKFEKSLQSTDIGEARSALTNATRIIDKSVTKGILHKNTAARRKSRLTKRFNVLGQTADNA